MNKLQEKIAEIDEDFFDKQNELLARKSYSQDSSVVRVVHRLFFFDDYVLLGLLKANMEQVEDMGDYEWPLDEEEFDDFLGRAYYFTHKNLRQMDVFHEHPHLDGLAWDLFHAVDVYGTLKKMLAFHFTGESKLRITE